MKILKIRLKNLNSLRGEWKISLDEEPIASAGLFAITGSTGAGKSTILDAISLALYGTTPRLGNISTSTLQDHGGILTRDCKDAYAEVDFEVKGKSYCASWKCKLTRTGNASAPEMLLTDLDEGKILSQKKSETTKLIEDIIGLDQNQFAQSILLSQGKFKEFLEAKADERTLLLENMTGAWIYRKIGKLVHEKHRALKLENDGLKKELEAIKILSEDELKEKKDQLNEKALQRKEKANVLAEVTGQLSKLKNLGELNSELERIQTKLQDLQHFSEVFQSEREKLSLHDKAVKLKPVFSELGYKENEIRSRKENVLRQQTIITDSYKINEKCIKELSSLANETAEVTTFDKILTGFKGKVEKLDKEFTEAKASFEPVRRSMVEAFKSFDEETKKQFGTDGQANHIYCQQQIARLKNKTEALQKRYAVTAGSINQRVQVLDEKLSHLPSLKQLLINEKALADKNMELLQIISELENEVPKLEEQKSIRINQQQKVVDEVTILSLNLDNEKLKDEVKYLRSKLIKGEPCPLCGSPDHKELSDTGEGLEKIKAKLDEAIKSEKRIASEITTILLTKDNLQKKQADYLKELEKIKVETEGNITLKIKLVKHLQLPEIISVNELEKIRETICQEKEDLQNLNRDLDLKDKFQQCKVLLQQYIESKERFEASKSKREGLGVGENILETLEQIKIAYHNSMLKIETAEHEKKLLEEGIHKLEVEVSELEVKLNSQLKELGFENLALAKTSIMSDKDAESIRSQDENLKNQLLEYKSKKEERVSDIKKIKTEIKEEINYEELKQQSEELEKYCSMLDQEIGAIRIVLEHDMQNRKTQEEKLAFLETSLMKLELYDIMRESIGDGEGKKFSKIMQRYTLRHLIALANQRLNEISGRYLLYIPEQNQTEADDKSQDQLMVIDRDMGDAVRIVSTLSGGESFMVSLALALALSDLAAGNIQIRSFFIDEGFGTLDPATLDLAISTLEKIQAENGKTVGVISHVDTLKERIACQVKVVKGVNGYSSVEVG